MAVAKGHLLPWGRGAPRIFGMLWWIPGCDWGDSWQRVQARTERWRASERPGRGTLPPAVEHVVDAYYSRGAQRFRRAVGCSLSGAFPIAALLLCGSHFSHLECCVVGFSAVLAVVVPFGVAVWAVYRVAFDCEPWGRVVRQHYRRPTHAVPAEVLSYPAAVRALGADRLLEDLLDVEAAEIFWGLQPDFGGSIGDLVDVAAKLAA